MKFINKRYFKGKFKKDEFHNGMFKDEFENVFKTLKHAENKDLDGKFVKGRIIGYVFFFLHFIGKGRVC